MPIQVLSLHRSSLLHRISQDTFNLKAFVNSEKVSQKQTEGKEGCRVSSALLYTEETTQEIMADGLSFERAPFSSGVARCKVHQAHETEP